MLDWKRLAKNGHKIHLTNRCSGRQTRCAYFMPLSSTVIFFLHFIEGFIACGYVQTVR